MLESWILLQVLEWPSIPASIPAALKEVAAPGGDYEAASWILEKPGHVVTDSGVILCLRLNPHCGVLSEWITPAGYHIGRRMELLAKAPLSNPSPKHPGILYNLLNLVLHTHSADQLIVYALDQAGEHLLLNPVLGWLHADTRVAEVHSRNHSSEHTEEQVHGECAPRPVPSIVLPPARPVSLARVLLPVGNALAYLCHPPDFIWPAVHVAICH